MKNAPVMAKAIVAHARDLEEAVTIAAWSVWEANMVTTALGDHGKSVGPLQLQAHVDIVRVVLIDDIVALPDVAMPSGNRAIDGIYP